MKQTMYNRGEAAVVIAVVAAAMVFIAAFVFFSTLANFVEAQTNTLDERISTMPAVQKASFKGTEIAKLGSVAKTQAGAYYIEINRNGDKYNKIKKNVL